MPERPPSDAVIRAWARLIRAQQAALAAVEAELKAAGFPPLAWYDALLELSRVDGAGLRPFALEQQLLLAQYNLSRLLDRLEKAGYVERQHLSGGRARPDRGDHQCRPRAGEADVADLPRCHRASCRRQAERGRGRAPWLIAR